MSARQRAIADETMDIVRRGGYHAPSGPWVDLRRAVDQSVSGTLLHQPDDELAPVDSIVERPSVEVTGESTLDAGRRLGPETAALVFASARNPGGGFRNGAKAQEEDIARASALHTCLTAAPEFYAYHRRHSDLRYSDHVIYSPDVPIFRGDDGNLLDTPYRLSFLTAAAPNLGAIAGNQPKDLDSVPAVLLGRAERVLRVAAAHGHRSIVLGAWGCGVFQNSPSVVAAAFQDGLQRVPHFERVVFAILDRTGNSPSRRAFAEFFA